jgi:DNA-directed RNA polymerase subunit RPC12/RpoP
MSDTPDGSVSLSTYECLSCGKRVEFHTHPLKCGDCGGLFHERRNAGE